MWLALNLRNDPEKNISPEWMIDNVPAICRKPRTHVRCRNTLNSGTGYLKSQQALRRMGFRFELIGTPGFAAANRSRLEDDSAQLAA